MADSGAEFERKLRKDLPRGQKGREDSLPRTRWADPAELPAGWDYAKGSGGLFLGYRGGRIIGWKDDRHALTVAGTRAGKGASLIVPNLLLYPGAVLAIDPKGELARITGRRRAELGKLVVLDPFGESGRKESGQFNPLDELDPKGKEVIDEAGAIAQALVVYSGQGDPHWTSAARALLRALILLVLTLEERYRNLISVCDLLMLNHDVLKANAAAQNLKPGIALFHMMKALGDDFERVVYGLGETFLDMQDKERESVLSEARTQTQFLDSPALRKVLENSSFRLAEFKGGKPLSVFLCLPARHMDTHDRWLRVIVNLAIGALEPRRSDAKDKDKPAVLLLLEEFPVLKHMEKLEAAAGQLAGSGVKLWVIVQNLGQLKRHYKDGWETFIANAGVITAFGNADLETLEYLSKKLGKVAMRVERNSGASSAAVLGGARLTQEELREWALLDTDEAPRRNSRARKGACWCWRRGGRRSCSNGRCTSRTNCSRECSTRDAADLRDRGRLPGGCVGAGGADRGDGVLAPARTAMARGGAGWACGVRCRAGGRAAGELGREREPDRSTGGGFAGDPAFARGCRAGRGGIRKRAAVGGGSAGCAPHAARAPLGGGRARPAHPHARLPAHGEQARRPEPDAALAPLLLRGVRARHGRGVAGGRCQPGAERDGAPRRGLGDRDADGGRRRAADRALGPRQVGNGGAAPRADRGVYCGASGAAGETGGDDGCMNGSARERNGTGGMRYLRGRWFLVWCVLSLLAGLALGSAWRWR